MFLYVGALFAAHYVCVTVCVYVNPGEGDAV